MTGAFTFVFGNEESLVKMQHNILSRVQNRDSHSNTVEFGGMQYSSLPSSR